MAKEFAAIGCYTAGEGAAPTSSLDPVEAYHKLSELLATKNSGDILYGDEYETVKDCIAAIGADETSVSEDYSFQGSGKYSYVAEGAGLKVQANVNLSCKGVYDRTRMEWTCNLGLNKIGGDAQALDVKWVYTIVSFGTSDPDGYPNIILKRTFDREAVDPASLAKLNGGKELDATYMDFSNNIQWGFFMAATCTINTSEGELVL